MHGRSIRSQPLTVGKSIGFKHLSIAGMCFRGAIQMIVRGVLGIGARIQASKEQCFPDP